MQLTQDRCYLAGCNFCQRKQFLGNFNWIKYSICHTPAAKLLLLWSDIWPKERARRVRVWQQTFLLLLGSRSHIRWVLEGRTMSDLYYCEPENVFFRWHEGIATGQTWHTVSERNSFSSGCQNSDVSKLLVEELHESSWTISLRNPFWSRTLRHRPSGFKLYGKKANLREPVFDQPTTECFRAVEMDDMYRIYDGGGAFQWHSGFGRN